MDYSPIIEEAGKQYNVDPALLNAMINQESGGNPNALSQKGASGLMQLMPDTAKELGVTDVNDPVQNIYAGARYMSQQLDKYGSVPLALAAYNAGAGAVDRHGGIPNYPETQNYVSKITSQYQQKKGKTMNNSGDPFTDLVMNSDQSLPAKKIEEVDPFAGLMIQKEKSSASKLSSPQEVDPFAGLMVPKNESKTNRPQDNTLYGNLSRQVGLTARAGLSGIAGLPLMAGDALNSVANLGISGINAGIRAINPEYQIPSMEMPSKAFNQILDESGLPQPQNSTERVVQDATSALSGAGGFIKAGQALANLGGSALAKGVGNTMQALPGMQLIGSAGSGIGGGVARENGYGATGQMLGGIAGGLTGVLGSSALTAAPSLLNKTIQQISGAAQPWTNPTAYVGKGIANQVGADAKVVADRIRNAEQFVPGSIPTTAQAGGGSTLVATEKAAANMYPSFKTQLADRAAENNLARWNALNNVARTPDELQAAINFRREISDPVYKSAHSNTVNVGDAFMRSTQIPEIKLAMDDANKLAALNAAAGRGVAPVWPTSDSKVINGAALDYTSRAIGDMIGAAKSSGQNTKAGALTAIKDRIDSWTERHIPGIAEAKKDYQSLSKPINTMEAANSIKSSLRGGNDVNMMPMISSNGYRVSLERALKDQEYGIDANALKQLQNIGKDLQRETTSNALRSNGSDTAYNISANGWLARQLYGDKFQGGSTAAKTLSGIAALVPLSQGNIPLSAAIAGGALGSNKIAGVAKDRLQTALQEILMNPEKILPYLDKAAQPVPQSVPISMRSNINQGLLGTFATERPSP